MPAATLVPHPPTLYLQDLGQAGADLKVLHPGHQVASIGVELDAGDVVIGIQLDAQPLVIILLVRQGLEVGRQVTVNGILALVVQPAAEAVALGAGGDGGGVGLGVL